MMCATPACWHSLATAGQIKVEEQQPGGEEAV
jgi:hypothetical protein